MCLARWMYMAATLHQLAQKARGKVCRHSEPGWGLFGSVVSAVYILITGDQLILPYLAWLMAERSCRGSHGDRLAASA